MKQTTILVPNVDKYTIDVSRRFSSNMLLNCLAGPERKVEDNSDSKLPEVYKKTKGAGFPSTNLKMSRSDTKLIRYPAVKQIANPMTLYTEESEYSDI
jgi:hypothetical protein